MRTGYFDCIAGASGDMILGALLDAGADEGVLRAELEKLGLDEFRLGVREVSKNGFAAKKVDVHVHDHAHARALPEIEAIVARSGIAPEIRRRAMDVFRIVGEAEAKIHNIPLEQVHLHELGGVDTIVDVVGALVAVELLGLERMVSSPLPLGRGFVSGAHGQIPLPAPATAAILKGVPVVGSEVGAELVTPTGAALLRYLCGSFGEMPAMTYDALGYGAGGRDLEIPNVLRLFVGTSDPGAGMVTESLTMLETNIDDMNPEAYGHVVEKLFEAGALDVYLCPMQMKKGRPGTMLAVLCDHATRGVARGILFSETTTLGVREHLVTRRSLRRRILTAATEHGEVRVKEATLPGGGVKHAPEFEDCKEIAGRTGMPLREVYDMVRAAVPGAGGGADDTHSHGHHHHGDGHHHGHRHDHGHSH